MVGSLVGGYLGDKLGRKYTMNIGIVICLVFGFISALSKNYIEFLLIRLITTIGVGLIGGNNSTHIGETFLKD